VSWTDDIVGHTKKYIGKAAKLLYSFFHFLFTVNLSAKVMFYT
jgi:hypothetical protein